MNRLILSNFFLLKFPFSKTVRLFVLLLLLLIRTLKIRNEILLPLKLRSTTTIPLSINQAQPR